MEEFKKFAVAYCRVSTEEQANNGLSLDVQEPACIEKIKQDGYELLKVIRDEGISAGTLKRPGMQEVVGLVVEGRASAVYALSSDRIFRNTADHLYFRDLLRKHEVKMIYVNQPNTDDSAVSRTMDTVVAAFNEMQRLVASEKVKGTLSKKTGEGYFAGKAPIGYKNMTVQSHNRFAQKIIIPDEMAPLVTEAFKLYATGNYSVRDLGDRMYSKGFRNRNGHKFSESRFYEFLRNPVYVGEVHWGKVHNQNGKHESLVDRETFQSVQFILDGHNQHACRRRKYSWLLSGFIYCSVHGKRYTAEWHLNKKIAYYHCTNKNGCGKYIEANTLESAIAEKFKDLEFNPDFVDRVINKVKEIFYLRRKNYESKRRALINQKAAFEAKMKVAEDKLLEKVIPDEEFTRIRTEIKSEIRLMEEKIFELDSAHDTKVDVAQEVLRFTQNIYKTYTSALPHLKRHYLGFFWERFEVVDGVIITSTPGLLFRELLRLEQVFVKTENSQKDNEFGGVIITTPMSG